MRVRRAPARVRAVARGRRGTPACHRAGDLQAAAAAGGPGRPADDRVGQGPEVRDREAADVVARLTGQSVPRREDARLLTGRGRYVDDVRAPGMLHAAFVRSHLPHARLRGIDVAAARGAPGVIAVLTDAELSALAADIQPSQMANLVAPPYPALARGKVRMVGEPVAMVVAESRYLAEDAAELVNVDYDPLPAVVDRYAALEPGSPLVFEEAGTNLLHHSEWLYGEPGPAFASAAHVVTESFRQD